MHALLKVLLASIYFSDKTHASNEKVKDKDLECTVKEKKEFQQVQGGYFLHIKLLLKVWLPKLNEKE